MLHGLCSQNAYAPKNLLPLNMYTHNAHHETFVPKKENTIEMPPYKNGKEETGIQKAIVKIPPKRRFFAQTNHPSLSLLA
jgi:hypothetical protein